MYRTFKKKINSKINCTVHKIQVGEVKVKVVAVIYRHKEVGVKLSKLYYGLVKDKVEASFTIKQMIYSLKGWLYKV